MTVGPEVVAVLDGRHPPPSADVGGESAVPVFRHGIGCSRC
jgi:hypothetical protein